jgi:hypothetical protein
MAGENYTYSGADARIRLGTIAVPCTKVEPPKESLKTEAVRRLGEQIAIVRTAGIVEIDGGSLELESAVFSRSVLPRVPANGWNEFEFVVTVTQRHPVLGNPYSQVWERVRFAGLEQDAIESSEKAIRIKLPILVIQIFHKGQDGSWKSFARNPALPTPQAAAFLF